MNLKPAWKTGAQSQNRTSKETKNNNREKKGRTSVSLFQSNFKGPKPLRPPLNVSGLTSTIKWHKAVTTLACSPQKEKTAVYQQLLPEHLAPLHQAVSELRQRASTVSAHTLTFILALSFFGVKPQDY